MCPASYVFHFFYIIYSIVTTLTQRIDHIALQKVTTMTRDQEPTRRTRGRPKAANCKSTADKFFTYLGGSPQHSKVTSKDELRNIFYGDFKASLESNGEKPGRHVGMKMCDKMYRL